MMDIALTTTAQATSDDRLVKLWLHGRSVHTQRAYRADAERFRSFAGKPLQQVTLADLRAFADSLDGLAPASRGRALSAVKSLLSFGHRLGYLPFDVGRALKLPSLKNRLAERILTEADVHRMLALEPSPRNRALLRLLYGGGLRVSEVCALVWRDVQPRDEAGQVTVTGRAARPVWSCCPPPPGRTWRVCATGLVQTIRCSGRGRAATWTRPRCIGSCGRPLAGRVSRPTCRLTGCATPTPATPWTAAHRSTWFRRRWDIRRWPPRGDTCTLGRRTAARGT